MRTEDSLDGTWTWVIALMAQLTHIRLHFDEKDSLLLEVSTNHFIRQATNKYNFVSNSYSF